MDPTQLGCLRFLQKLGVRAMPFVEVFLPCFNTGKKSLDTIETVTSAFSNFDLEYRITAINDGSLDDTKRYLRLGKKRNGKRLQIIENTQNIGIGASISPVIKASKSDFFLFLPGDNDVPEASILKLLNSIPDVDMAVLYIVNREVRGPLRNFISSVYNLVLMTLCRTYLLYATGPGIYRTSLIKDDKLRSKRFGVIAELNVKTYFKSHVVGQGSLCVANGTEGSTVWKLSVAVETVTSLLVLICTIIYRKSLGDCSKPKIIDINNA